MFSLSLRELRNHPLRYGLAALAVVLGVGVFCATRVASASLAASLAATIDRIAGNTVFEVTADESGVPEGVVPRLRAIPGVRAANPVVEARVETVEPAGEALLLLGLDLVRDPRVGRQSGAASGLEGPARLVRSDDGLVVSRAFAEDHDLKTGDTVTLATALGDRRFAIVGLLEPRGLARAYGSRIGVTGVRTLQEVLGRGHRFDRVDVEALDGAGIEELRRAISDALGDGYTVAPPARRGRQIESLTAAFALILLFSSTMALLVGGFLIFNSVSIGVRQRRRQIGVLRALGLSRLQVGGLFLAESLALGGAASVVGVLGGVALGRLVMIALAATAEQVYGVAVATEALSLDAASLLLSLGLGLVTSALGGLLPALAAARVEPSEALRPGVFEAVTPGRNPLRQGLGMVAVALGLLLPVALGAAALPVQLATLALLFLGLTLLVPTASHWLARSLRWPLERLFGLEGRLAADSLVWAPRRTSATVAALMFCLAFAVSSASFSGSVRTSMLTWVSDVINPDLLVSASRSFASRTFQFPASMQGDLQAIPGVAQVDALRMIALNETERAPVVLSMEIGQFLRRAKPVLVEGSLDGLERRMTEERGVLISNNLARLRHLGAGDSIEVATPTGRHTLPIVGVQVDYTSENGTLFLDRALYRRLWRDDRVDTYEVMVTPGTDVGAVKREIERRFAGRRSLQVLTNAEFRDEVQRLAGQFWLLTFAQLGVALVVATLGIFGSLTVSIRERAREIGILRALGGERRALRRTVVLEAVAVGATGLVLGALVGTTVGWWVVARVGAAVTGWVFPYRAPWVALAILAPAVLAICVGAAWYPASVAARRPAVRSLVGE